MTTSIRIFLKQTCRSTKRLVLQLVLLCTTVTFFVVSLNLYANSRQNLIAVESAYTTMATMEIYGDVNATGDLVNPSVEDYVGRYLLSPDDFDLASILELPGVIGYDLRQRYAAYLPDEVLVNHITDKSNIGYPNGLIDLVGHEDVLRFTIDSETPIEIPITLEGSDIRPAIKTVRVPIRLLDQTLPHIAYPNAIYLKKLFYFPEELEHHAAQIQRLNRCDRTDAIILYPNVEYVLAGYFSVYFNYDAATNTYTFMTNKSMSDAGGILFDTIVDLHSYLQGDVWYDRYGNIYSASNAIKDGAPYRLQRYEDVKNDPEWAKSVECIEYDNYSIPLTLTNDIQTVPAWYTGGMYLSEGRMITKEEYASGAKVCMISAKLAAYQGWKIGDTLKMQCYDYDGYADRVATSLHTPRYYRGLDGFFYADEYEIVGIFGQRDIADAGGINERVLFNPWNTIYAPANSVEDAPEEPVQASTLSILLKNGSIDQFKDAVKKAGLSEPKTGQYQLIFNYFDQGYDKIKPGLMEMHRNAKTLLGLSSVLMLVTMILMSFLFSRQHKHSAGILRMLGGGKKQAFAAILACGAMIVLVSGIVGMVLGVALTQNVGDRIMGDMESTTVALATGANTGLTILTGLGCIMLFLALTAIFTATYIGKEPRALLPKDQA